ncbi:Eukaryotic translation initiation factor 5 [Nosema granulosis]|uniref:Eukaryotic translation initiation factor 5 n=1 Tax=Nosema granulosis TaxID=83296 RepID=A0A9P6GZ75_9MICR|nr:Eukaryotic translation initiation factor 5 [Nosema granulosis]
MIDINRTTTDLHYRYKMPRISIQHSGGSKTILVNLQEVSSSLKRDPLHILKYISYDLATQTKVDSKKYIVNGKHDARRIQDCIFDFIDLFVLCSKCENPETFYVDAGGLSKECLACGEKTKVPNHKLNATILKDLDKQDYNNMYTKFTTEEEVDIKEVVKENVNSAEIYEALKKRGVPEEKMLPTILNFGESFIPKCGEIVKNLDKKVLFSSVDDFIESSKKTELVPAILDLLKESGIKKNELFKFFSRPQNNKKRSLEFKNEVNKYFG